MNVKYSKPLPDLIEELSQIEEYPGLFESTFGDTEVNAERISFALSQFIRSMVSFDSKFDQGYSNDFSNFTQVELDGKDLFFSGDYRCNHCHSNLNFFVCRQIELNFFSQKISECLC